MRMPLRDFDVAIGMAWENFPPPVDYLLARAEALAHLQEWVRAHRDCGTAIQIAEGHSEKQIEYISTKGLGFYEPMRISFGDSGDGDVQEPEEDVKELAKIYEIQAKHVNFLHGDFEVAESDLKWAIKYEKTSARLAARADA